MVKHIWYINGSGVLIKSKELSILLWLKIGQIKLNAKQIPLMSQPRHAKSGKPSSNIAGTFCGICSKNHQWITIYVYQFWISQYGCALIIVYCGSVCSNGACSWFLLPVSNLCLYCGVIVDHAFETMHEIYKTGFLLREFVFKI